MFNAQAKHSHQFGHVLSGRLDQEVLWVVGPSQQPSLGFWKCLSGSLFGLHQRSLILDYAVGVLRLRDDIGVRLRSRSQMEAGTALRIWLATRTRQMYLKCAIVYNVSLKYTNIWMYLNTEVHVLSSTPTNIQYCNLDVSESECI